MKLPHRRPSRVVVEPIAPLVDGGRFPAKIALGEPLVVTADVFADGHDAINTAVRWRAVEADGHVARWSEAAMQPLGNDRWTATIPVDQVGRIEYDVIGWSNPAETWRRGLITKIDAGYDVTLERKAGRRIVNDLLDNARRSTSGRAADDIALLENLRVQLAEATDVELAELLSDGSELIAGTEAGPGQVARPLARDSADESADESAGDGAGETVAEPVVEPVRESDGEAPGHWGWAGQFWRYSSREPRASLPAPLAVDVDRTLGRCSAWYEFFPRSTVGDATGHATLRDAIDRLDYIAAMGFDVVYLPPISPIGAVNRKGANNNPVAADDDTGSPWGIADHTAVHPDLGTLADVKDLIAACDTRGLELALDIAFQVTPDHPWVDDNPDWFIRRADGSIQYAENPPKKYQDIYPINFETDDWESLWLGLADVFRFWIDQGVRIFRVDNPHTKAFPFWEWCIATLRQEYPDTIFLAEAFTRPRVMERLAKLGFNQSYTYFTWRRTAGELREYFTDLSTRTVDYYRPNAWPNTPDILPDQLQEGGKAMFAARGVLAATLSANWGIYGPAFELLESRPLKPGSEEYLDSEKYQVRQWDLDDPESIAPLVTRLNEIRRDEPAFGHLRTLRFHDVDSDSLLCFSKTDPNGVGGPVLVVVNVDARHTVTSWVHVDPTSFGIGLGHDEEYDVVDLLDGATYRWQGWHNPVELGPERGIAHVFSVRPVSATDPIADGG